MGSNTGGSPESWSEVVGQVPEAPNDQVGYLRKNEAWSGFSQTVLDETATSISFSNEGGVVVGSPSAPSTVAAIDIVGTNAVAGTVAMNLLSRGSYSKFHK